MKQDNGAQSSIITAKVQGPLLASTFLIYLAFIIIGLVVIVNYFRPEPEFYIETEAGMRSEVFPLDEPNITPSSLVNWSTIAATSAYTIDFYNYQDNIDALREYFTADGYAQYLDALSRSGLLERITNDKIVVSAVASNTAVILGEAPLRGVYSWRIQVPLLVTYQGASEDSTQQNIVVEMLVSRVPTNQSTKGIGIAQMVSEESYGQS